MSATSYPGDATAVVERAVRMVKDKQVRAVDGSVITFDYEAKGGKRRVQVIGDPEVAEIAGVLKKRRGGGD